MQAVAPSNWPSSCDRESWIWNLVDHAVAAVRDERDWKSAVQVIKAMTIIVSRPATKRFMERPPWFALAASSPRSVMSRS